jgi:HK97 family phage major capsid protein
MRPNPIDLRQQACDATAQARTIIDGAANRDLNDDEVTQIETLEGRARSLQRQALALERFDETEALAERPTERRSDPLQPEVRGSDGSDLLPHQLPGRHQYSLLRAINQVVEGRRVDGLEGETAVELARRSSKAPRGFLVPMDLPIWPGPRPERRALDTTAAAGAIFEFPTQTIAGLLRNRVLAAQLGCTFLTGLQGQAAIPNQTAGATFGWVAEGSNATASNLTIGQVELRPATLTGYTEMTRSMLKQTAFDMEAFARQDLADGLAVALDKAVFAGSGTGVEPTGLTTYPGVTTIAMGANGAAPSWGAVVGLETAVSVANADVGRLGYATNAKVRGKCKTTPKVDGFPMFLWENDGINGYSAGVSNHIPGNLTKGDANAVCSALFFGNWADLIVALWGGVDVLPDPYTQAPSGSVRIHIYQDADIELRRTESFARITDLLTA